MYPGILHNYSVWQQAIGYLVKGIKMDNHTAGKTLLFRNHNPVYRFW